MIHLNVTNRAAQICLTNKQSNKTVDMNGKASPSSVACTSRICTNYLALSNLRWNFNMVDL